MAKRITGKSGLRLWTMRVRKSYDSLEELQAYCDLYGIAERLGYKSAASLWKANPVIGGSAIPSDLCVIKRGR